MTDERHPRSFDFDAERFEELIVYIAQKCTDDPTFGAVKLNKILYYSDFDAYRHMRQPISGATYRKLQAGPAPKELQRSRDKLIEEGRLILENRPYFNRLQKRLALAPGAQANAELFTAREREIVDEVIQFFWGKSAREVSDYSHREPGWKFAEEFENIPYETAWLSGDPIDQETEETAQRIGRDFLESRRRKV